MQLEEIAKKLNCKLTGQGDIEIKRVAGIKEAVEGDLTFLANPRYISDLKRIKASAIIISNDYSELDIPTLRTDNPYLVFAKALELFYKPVEIWGGIHQTSVISPTAHIGKNPSIQPYVVVGEKVLIGDDVVVYPNVTIYPDVVIGNNVIIHSNSIIREHTVIGNNVIIQNGVVIGGDGYAFAKADDGTYYKMTQLGHVIIEDNVEIQSNSVIERATVGKTIIKKGAKISSLVEIAHSCSIGENAIVCGLVGVAGSTTIGNNVMLAGQVGVTGHINIGDNVCVTAKSAVLNSVEKNHIVSGIPAIESFLWKKALVCFAKLPQLFKRIKKIEKFLNRFEERIDGK